MSIQILESIANSQILLFFVIALLIALVFLLFHYNQHHNNKDKYQTIKRITFMCTSCNKIDTYSNVDILNLIKLYPCQNVDCKQKEKPRKIIDFVK